MAYGEWMALRQEDLKRMLAYSTMGQVGEIFTVLGLGTWLAAAARCPCPEPRDHEGLALPSARAASFSASAAASFPDLAGLVHEMPWAVAA